MGDEQSKIKNSRRRQKDDNAVSKQVKIAKQHGMGFNDVAIKEPHRHAKRHAMDCGNPECFLCGNPRRTHKDKLTAQEKRMLQDIDKTTDRHSNGIKNDEEDIL